LRDAHAVGGRPDRRSTPNGLTRAFGPLVALRRTGPFSPIAFESHRFSTHSVAGGGLTTVVPTVDLEGGGGGSERRERVRRQPRGRGLGRPGLHGAGLVQAVR